MTTATALTALADPAITHALAGGASDPAAVSRETSSPAGPFDASAALPDLAGLLGAYARAAGLEAGAVTLHTGWDLDHERALYQRADEEGRAYLSVRVAGDEVQAGPLWVPGTDSGCPGCAETRARIAVDHPLADRIEQPLRGARPPGPFLAEALAAALDALTAGPLAPGELLAVGGAGIARHRIVRTFNCAVCAEPAPVPDPSARPPRLVLDDPAASPGDPVRGTGGDALLAPGALRRRLVDPRFGPVLQVMRDLDAPYAMSNAVLPESPAHGYGRALTFERAESVAVLEAYERMGSFPHHGQVLTGLSYRDVADRAIDPAGLGTYTEEQLAHPLCRVIPSTPDTPMDWVWGHDLATGEPTLVPAEIGFYRYEYLHRHDRHGARRDQHADRRRSHFPDSSSGCALGSGLTEAALHSLLELAERDAFLLSWHRARPLPAIDPASLADPVSRRLLDTIDIHGYDAHLLVATQDIDIPLVWAMAVNRTGGHPASWSAAGSGADPESAVRAALWELTQMCTRPPADPEAGAAMVADPWQVDLLEDHVDLYNRPETLPRVTAVLGGPRVTLQEAFPEWPDRLLRAAGGTVRGALDFVRARFADAGLDRIVLVDQSTRDHADLGLAVAKAVVPGILPMCFGHAQQRLAGLPRLAAALRGTPQEHRNAPYDPHPFP
ncbi:TOMM precursor leader peptide-binding protein [Streptomyces sp. NPDC048387]|uniref:TOMM precursor leader peptide-binding protein n=1 Tax=Streptomyces sp. NPDC048387 TaxID=3365542 RepID=UPI00371038A2